MTASARRKRSAKDNSSAQQSLQEQRSQQGVQPSAEQSVEQQGSEQGVQPSVEQAAQQSAEPTAPQVTPHHEIEPVDPVPRVEEEGQPSGTQKAKKGKDGVKKDITKKASHLVPQHLKKKGIPAGTILGLPADGGKLLFGYKDSWAREIYETEVIKLLFFINVLSMCYIVIFVLRIFLCTLIGSSRCGPSTQTYRRTNKNACVAFIR